MPWFSFSMRRSINDWPFGKIYCKISQFITTLSISVSVFTLMAKPIDRGVDKPQQRTAAATTKRDTNKYKYCSPRLNTHTDIQGESTACKYFH